MRRYLRYSLIGFLLLTPEVRADLPQEVTFDPVDLQASDIGHGWRKWEGLLPGEQNPWYPKFISALSVDGEGALWIGTSQGDLIVFDAEGEKWRTSLPGLQITDFAFETSEQIWLSTGNGIVRMKGKGPHQWEVRHLEYYYEGSPAFVSALYEPGLDSRRLWGYVDHIYFPLRIKHYAPFVISREHGLFSVLDGNIQHHFFPHYWGWNSPWLDTRELIPHRRPTCMVEDGASNLWIGTEWDGLVRLNAQARRYCERRDDDNQKDGTEFSFFGPEEMGVDLVRVVDLASSAEPDVVWALIQSKDGGTFLARFDGEEWEVLALADQAKGARSVNETWPEEVLLGSQWGLFEVDWASQRVEKSSFPGHSIWKVEVTPGESVFVAAPDGVGGFVAAPDTLYELP